MGRPLVIVSFNQQIRHLSTVASGHTLPLALCRPRARGKGNASRDTVTQSQVPIQVPRQFSFKSARRSDCKAETSSHPRCFRYQRERMCIMDRLSSPRLSSRRTLQDSSAQSPSASRYQGCIPRCIIHTASRPLASAGQFYSAWCMVFRRMGCK